MIKEKIARQIVINEIISVRGTICGACREELGGKYALQYITPLSDGGTEVIGNIKLVHKKCKTDTYRRRRITKARMLIEEGKGPQEVAHILGMSLPTVLRYIKTSP